MASRRPPPNRGVTSKWLIWTLFALSSHNVLASGTDPPISIVSSQNSPGRSPAGIPPPLIHEVTTPKFRNTHTNEEEERYHPALAPGGQVPAVRAPTAQSIESQELLPQNARLLSHWEADDIVLLSTVDGALHARDRRTGRPRWTISLPNSPMIETTHYQQKRPGGDGLQIQDPDYVFIVEPSKDGKLFVQFADPKMGLVELGATVRKMATEVPLAIQMEDQYLTTTARQESKAYTIDAQTGEILYEFPRSNLITKSQPQPRCRPRNGLDFEDPACKPGRTLRLGRTTYTFTISNEATDQDLCKITFSEWVTNKHDNDLQYQHRSPLDDYDLQTFYNGQVIGFDTSLASESSHKYRYTLDTPVARIFDVARKVDTDEDDSADLVLLARTPEFRLPVRQTDTDPLRDRRVFIDRTENGTWFALSEQSYPGVTLSAKIANVVRSPHLMDLLDLRGDMKDIVGVHLLKNPGSQVQDLQMPTERLGIAGPANAISSQAESGMIAKTDNYSVETELVAPTYWNRVSDGFWGAVVTLLLCILAYSWRHYSKEGRMGILADFAPPNTEVAQIEAPKVEIEPMSPASLSLSEALSPSPATPADSVPISEVVTSVEATTPAHSRQTSLLSNTSPSRNGKSLAESQNASDAESDAEEDGQDQKSDAPLSGARKPKKTKRGVRGGRRNNKKKSTGDATTFEPKPIISQEKHLSNGMVQVGRLTYDSKLESCLGQGSSGTAVFPGTFDGRVVAVKRLVKTANSLAEKEIRHLVSSDENPNVIRYHGKEESPSFFFIALDRFDTSLDQFVEYPEKYPALVSPTRGYDVKDALRQITRGVQHLHSLKLVHRDIKPQNILVRPVKTARALPEGQLTPLLFVISDFGLCKPLEDGPESVFAATRTAAGTTGWKAPELLVSSRDAIAAPPATSSHQYTDSSSHSQNHSVSKSTTTSTTGSENGTTVDLPTGRRATKAIDVFSLGCVFFYVMTRGGHPFDRGYSPLARDLNIKENNFDTSLLRDSFLGYDYDADDLIMQMIMHNPKDRPDTSGVLAHPYFWKVEHKLDFLCAVSDNYEERKQKITNIHDESAPRTETERAYLAELAALQSKAPNVIGMKKDGVTIQDFLSALPKSFLTEMGKQRKYTGTKMIDLLRVIRNKRNHFHDLPNEVKELMLKAGRPPGSADTNNSQIEGYYNFWRERFPSLLVNCIQLLQERHLVEEFGLERYYDGTVL